MKFAKELNEELVPEWRVKYVDYKKGKKKVKAVAKAVKAVQRSPRSVATSKESFRNLDCIDETSDLPSRPIPIDGRNSNDNLLNQEEDEAIYSPGGTRWKRYGSIVGSPQSPSLARVASLNLGQPAIDTDSDESAPPGSKDGEGEVDRTNRRDSAPPSTDNAFEIGRTRSPSRMTRFLSQRHQSDSGQDYRPSNLRTQTGNGSNDSSSRISNKPIRKRGHLAREDSLFRRVFDRSRNTKGMVSEDVPLQYWKAVEDAKQDFESYMSEELEKVNHWYNDREEVAEHRLDLLRWQLHKLRESKMAQYQNQQGKSNHPHEETKAAIATDANSTDPTIPSNVPRHSLGNIRNLPQPSLAVLHPVQAVKQVSFGTPRIPNMLGLATPPSKTLEASRDFIRQDDGKQPTYATAKRSLKQAFHEFYRGLELLRNYAILNRTAFRKINKKYDKAARNRRKLAWYNTHVEKANFVTSDSVDHLIAVAEDLYARYFYNANRKVAASKLRRHNRLAGTYTSSVFRNGLFVGLGSVFGIEALVLAADDFYNNGLIDPVFATNTSYLMQIYAGYFLLLLLMLLFCLDCRIFHEAKVNYEFIFEFNTRHNLDWRQLSELPCFFYFVMGLCMWLNFLHDDGFGIRLWWPVILICTTVFIVFLPLPILYHQSRKWTVQSLGKLLTPWRTVEFKDFFLGDMMCSQTYAIGGIELFFCLYATSWTDPSRCNSSHSRLLGFLSTLPGIIRMVQCFRRYADTRAKFPHLANAAKYGCTIMQYMTLSIFRIQKTLPNRAVFVLFATINSIYTSSWDLVVDWSLLDFRSHNFLLRDTLAYKQHWSYYAAMIIDPIIRFNWIFYGIPYFSDELQHSAILSFLIALTEVFRRGMWVAFRVENEHCTNVGRFRASRDVKLPFKMNEATENHPLDHDPSARRIVSSPNPASIASTKTPRRRLPGQSSPHDTDIEAGVTTEHQVDSSPGMASLRRYRSRQGMTPSQPSPGQGIVSRIGTILQGAHAQDFERRRKPYSGDARSSKEHLAGDEEDDEEDEDEDEDVHGTDAEGRAARGDGDGLDEPRGARSRTGEPGMSHGD